MDYVEDQWVRDILDSPSETTTEPEATEDSGEIDLESVPESLRDVYLQQQAKETEQPEEKSQESETVSLADLEKSLGQEGVQALTALLSDDSATVQSVLSPEVVEDIIYSSLDTSTPEGQQNVETLLADPVVLETISNQLFGGVPVEQIRELIEYYGDVDPQQVEQINSERQSYEQHYNTAASEVERSTIVEVEESVSKQFPSLDPEEREFLRQGVLAQFVVNNESDYKNLLSAKAAGNNYQVTVLGNKLASKFEASLIKTYSRYSAQSKPTKAENKQAAPNEQKQTKKAELPDIDSYNYASEFSRMFAEERKARGL